MDKEDLKSRLNYCRGLAEEGHTKLAYLDFENCVKEFTEGVEKNREDILKSNDPLKTSEELKKYESILEVMERTGHRIGVNIAVEHAKFFYQKGDKNAARQWLYHAQMHTQKLTSDISDIIFEMKDKYKDIGWIGKTWKRIKEKLYI